MLSLGRESNYYRDKNSAKIFSKYELSDTCIWKKQGNTIIGTNSGSLLETSLAITVLFYK